MKAFPLCLAVLFCGLSALAAGEVSTSGTGSGEGACFHSYNRKWELWASWTTEHRSSSDCHLVHTPSGKSYPLMIFGKPQDMDALWSPDERYVAIFDGTETQVFSLENDKPTALGSPYRHGLEGGEPFEVSLLKEKEKPRFDPKDEGTLCTVRPRQWAGAQDLVFACDLKGKLRATSSQPTQTLHVLAAVTIRVGQPGKERIVSGKYEAYDIGEPTAFGPPLAPIPMARPDQAPEGLQPDQEPEARGLQLVHYGDGQGRHEIWLKDYAAKQMTRLYEYDRSAMASLSGDGNTVVITDRFASNASKIALLLKDQQGRWHQVNTDGVAQAGLELMRQVFSLKKTPNIDHLYCNVPEPPEDGSQVIDVVIWGYESGVQNLDHWFFSYDLAAGKAFVADEAATRKAGLPLHPMSRAEAREK